MQNENQKLNPLTCELQVGDVVEVISSEVKYIAEIVEIVEISGLSCPFKLRTETFCFIWRDRSELRLIFRNGKPIEEQWQPKTGDIVWCKFLQQPLIIDCREQSRPCFWCFFTDETRNKAFPVPVSELEPYTGQDKPKIDFGKTGLILTDGDILVITAGEEGSSYFKAFCLFQSKDLDSCPYNKHNGWRDITAEAQPIIEQLKQLME